MMIDRGFSFPIIGYHIDISRNGCGNVLPCTISTTTSTDSCSLLLGLVLRDQLLVWQIEQARLNVSCNEFDY